MAAVRPSAVIVFVVVAVLAAHAARACQNELAAGTLQVNGIPSSGSTVLGCNKYETPLLSVSGNQVRVKHGPRAYLGQCVSSFSGSSFTKIPLLGRSLSATVDLSGVGCGCNLSLYLVDMPAIGSNGQPDPTSGGDYYCDANDVESEWCPEIDLMEANNMAFQATPHKCNSPWGNGHYTDCDRGGCGMNTYKIDPNSYGPGSQYTINTNNAFQFNTTFVETNGQLTAINTVLSQGSKTFTMAHTDSNCGGGYLESLTSVVKSGMVLVFSSWGDSGGTMSWLDVPPCNGGSNCNNGAATFSNIAVF